MIDYQNKHRHLPGSLSCLPIIADIYRTLDLDHDVFILSKGHSCSALYAVLEACGFKPDVTKVHPERDVENGVTMTAGSLGHGLPTAIGIAWAKRHKNSPGTVHVLLGGGECQEGTTWEGFHLLDRFGLKNIVVHIDHNEYQGSDPDLSRCIRFLELIGSPSWLAIHRTKKGDGIPMFENDPVKSVHLVSASDFEKITSELVQA